MKLTTFAFAAAIVCNGWGAAHPNSAALTEFHTGMTFGFGCAAGYFAALTPSDDELEEIIRYMHLRAFGIEVE